MTINTILTRVNYKYVLRRGLVAKFFLEHNARLEKTFRIEELVCRL